MTLHRQQVKNKKIDPKAPLPGVGGPLLDLNYPTWVSVVRFFSYGNFIAKYPKCKCNFFRVKFHYFIKTNKKILLIYCNFMC